MPPVFVLIIYIRNTDYPQCTMNFPSWPDPSSSPSPPLPSNLTADTARHNIQEGVFWPPTFPNSLLDQTPAQLLPQVERARSNESRGNDSDSDSEWKQHSKSNNSKSSPKLPDTGKQWITKHNTLWGARALGYERNLWAYLCLLTVSEPGIPN